MDAWTGPEYVVYATMLIEYGHITRGRQIRKVMKVVIHGIVKECVQCGEVPSIKIMAGASVRRCSARRRGVR